MVESQAATLPVASSTIENQQTEANNIGSVHSSSMEAAKANGHQKSMMSGSDMSSMMSNVPQFFLYTKLNQN